MPDESVKTVVELEAEFEAVAGVAARLTQLSKDIVERLRTQVAQPAELVTALTIASCLAVELVTALTIASCLAVAEIAVGRDWSEEKMVDALVREVALRVTLARVECRRRRLVERERARRTSVVDDGPEIDGN